ncbi:GGDEF domain-containing protein [Actinoplanes sp. L3-i22]|uniref:GGDEF domain-containing protein n=1 Tax=Actinoplanes sp. L3-i22 TaxID=2836373 RepID=UPI001C791C8A|nr:GGDEF domain-containing protein [Actinoplanes sp. L3-i22]BCY13012.1 GGDEF domain-containing protein [Actinoplanes sp. L3-i22]
MVQRRRAAGIAAILFVAVYLLLVRVLPFPALVAGRISQSALVVAGLTVTVVWARAARRATGRMRVGLTLWSVAALAWAGGEAIWVVQGWATGLAPVVSIANACFAVTIVATPLASVLLVGRLSASLRTLFDALMIGTSLFFVVWALILGPAHRSGDTNLGTVIYALADVVVLSLVLLLLADSGPALRTPLEISAIGIVVMFAADSTYAYQTVAGTYRFGALPDLLWLVAFGVIAVGAPHRSELRGVTRVSDGGRPRAYLPYVPFLLALVTGVAMQATRQEMDRVLAMLSMTLTALVVLRQMLILGDNRRLTRQLSALVDDLRYRADHDALTGLANRSRFEECAEQALLPGAPGPVSLLLIDLDGFKPVNDTYGHHSGDRVLAEVARRLTAAAGPGDLVARVGGDEFAVLTVTDPGPVADRVLAAFRAAFDVGDETAVIGASIGVTSARPGGHGVGQLVRDADAAMYEAKRGGRNNVVTAARVA